ncbi:hypothetical protein K449DRAFT_393309 [Hypoxylon sp. EC38]|nr:hypothetical protein K449DRAFT_393309 [Hypoxylon sp. EC38]OTA96419.1 hypothetical protein M434DRAFT_8866 [Hypoxylon sp. CO27-5]
MDPDDNDSGNIFATYPFSWVLVPLIIFVGAGTLLMCYRYRRRKKLRMLYGTNALERDLEAMGHRPRPRAPNERRARERRGLGFGLGSREEGLNELGEAPPAYTAPQKHPEDTEGVELGPIQQPPNTTATEGASTSRPPAYEDLQRERNQSQSPPPISPNLPAPPPRAVLSSD